MRERLRLLVAILFASAMVIGSTAYLHSKGEPALPAGLSWAPPELVNPETVVVTNANRSLELAIDRDYLITFSGVLTASGGLSIYGGHNVVLIGGEIAPSGNPEDALSLRGLYLRDQTGTVHIEGVRFSGGNLREGIDLDQRRGATVQLQNLSFPTVYGELDGHHADVLQTWAGPKTLRIDRLQGRSTYQGFFLLPNQLAPEVHTSAWDLRRVDLELTSGAGYGLWKQDGLSVRGAQLHVRREGGNNGRELWPTEGSWPDVATEAEDVGQASVLLGNPGLGYQSPGYEAPTRDN